MTSPAASRTRAADPNLTAHYASFDEAMLLNLAPDLRRESDKQFVVWREELRDDNWTKPLINPHTGGNAMANNPKTWGTLTQALNYLRKNRKRLPNLRGIGRVLVAADGMIVFDFDDCLDEEGNVVPGTIAAYWVLRLNSYTEVTPSGRGLRVWVYATHDLGGATGRNRKPQGYEIYREKKYLTLTGNRFFQVSGNVEHRQAEVDAFHAEVMLPAQEPIASKPMAAPSPVTNLSDAEIIDRARRAKNGADFWALWTGNIGKRNPSEADLALCNHLRFWTGGDPIAMERLFSQSALGQRDKWKDRADYRKLTIDRSLRSRVDVYTAPAPRNDLPNNNKGKKMQPEPKKNRSTDEPQPKPNGAAHPNGAAPTDNNSDDSRTPIQYPFPFKTAESGVYHVGEDKDGNEKYVWLCARLDVIAKTCDDRGADWGLLLRWKDERGHEHSWAMPKELLYGDGAAVRGELARQGLSIATERGAREYFLSYLARHNVANFVRCVSRLGWHGVQYVLPTKTIGGSNEQVVFQNRHALEPAFSTLGTLEEWKDNVAALAQWNSRITFCICVALAGPLVEPAGEGSGGFHLRGGSSMGKTTGLWAGASVWGNPQSYCRLWCVTINGLEGLAVLHNDGVLILDELGQVDARDAGRTAYLLGNGLGKTRAGREGAARPAATWRLIYLSAGEQSLAAISSQVNLKITTGQEVRLADFDADAGAGLGVFEDLHDCESGHALAIKLSKNTCRYHGAVGMAWLEWLVKNRPALKLRIADYTREFVAQHAADASGQVQRVAKRFALVALAGELGTEAGLTGWQEGEAEDAVVKCFKAWLQSFGGGKESREERAVLAHVRKFISLHGASRFQDAAATDTTFTDRVPNRAGFFRTRDGQREYLVLADVFDAEVCQGHDPRFVKKVLRSHGWLKPGSDGRNDDKPYIAAIGDSTRVYVIGGKLWTDDVEL